MRKSAIVVDIQLHRGDQYKPNCVVPSVTDIISNSKHRIMNCNIVDNQSTATISSAEKTTLDRRFKDCDQFASLPVNFDWNKTFDELTDFEPLTPLLPTIIEQSNSDILSNFRSNGSKEIPTLLDISYNGVIKTPKVALPMASQVKIIANYQSQRKALQNVQRNAQAEKFVSLDSFPTKANGAEHSPSTAPSRLLLLRNQRNHRTPYFIKPMASMGGSTVYTQQGQFVRPNKVPILWGGPIKPALLVNSMMQAFSVNPTPNKFGQTFYTSNIVTNVGHMVVKPSGTSSTANTQQRYYGSGKEVHVLSNELIKPMLLVRSMTRNDQTTAGSIGANYIVNGKSSTNETKIGHMAVNSFQIDSTVNTQHRHYVQSNPILLNEPIKPAHLVDSKIRIVHVNPNEIKLSQKESGIQTNVGHMAVKTSGTSSTVNTHRRYYGSVKKPPVPSKELSKPMLHVRSVTQNDPITTVSIGPNHIINGKSSKNGTKIGQKAVKSSQAGSTVNTQQRHYGQWNNYMIQTVPINVNQMIFEKNSSKNVALMAVEPRLKITMRNEEVKSDNCAIVATPFKRKNNENFPPHIPAKMRFNNSTMLNETTRNLRKPVQLMIVKNVALKPVPKNVPDVKGVNREMVPNSYSFSQIFHHYGP